MNPWINISLVVGILAPFCLLLYSLLLSCLEPTDGSVVSCLGITNSFVAGLPAHSLFELHVNYYRSSVLLLNTNLFLQIVFNLLALRIIFGDDSGIRIPILEIPISVTHLYFVVPITLSVLWLQFGFQLHNVIQIRSEMWNLICDTIGKDVDRQFKAAVSLFEDSMLIDGWFYLNREDHLLNFNRYTTFALLSITYCILLGTTNLHILLVPLIMHRKGIDIIPKPLLMSFVFILLAVLLLSHVQFFCSNKNYLQYVIAFVTIASLFVSLWFMKTGNPSQM